MATVGIDHVAFPVADVARTIAFYSRLGFAIEDEDYRAGRSRIFSIRISSTAKLNVHPPELPSGGLRASQVVVGSTDICFVWDGSAADCERMLAAADVEIAAGPLEGGGARGGVLSSTRLYARDPDGNLLEWVCYAMARDGDAREQLGVSAERVDRR